MVKELSLKRLIELASISVSARIGDFIGNVSFEEGQFFLEKLGDSRIFDSSYLTNRYEVKNGDVIYYCLGTERTGKRSCVVSYKVRI